MLWQAGPILDHNGHPVPDGSQVIFRAESPGGTLVAASHSAMTVDGLADATITLNSPGLVHFRVESGDTHQSEVVALTIQPFPTSTTSPSPTSTASPPPPTPAPTTAPAPSSTPGPSAALTGEATPPPGSQSRSVDGADLALAALTVLLVGAGGCWFLGLRGKRRTPAIRWILLALVGGMGAYILYAAQWVRPETWANLPEGLWIARAAMVATVALGTLLPLAIVAGAAKGRA